MSTAATLGQLLEASPSLRQLLIGIDRAAASSRPLLVVGEAGTGRSALARACHLASPRHRAPLVEVDTPSIPPSLFESELFGHEPGAFTGASRPHRGRVERAEGGTLVLDRIEMLPDDCQPKLLRLLAEARYTPLGGSERQADVRFIAIGADDLAARAANGRFRADLYFRLEVLAFSLPPLRERSGDLETLASALLADLGRQLDRPPPRLSHRALGWMRDHPWPGNLRQLRNLLERAMLASDAGEIDPPTPQERAPEPESLLAVERQHILRVLAHTRGHQGEAARILGISRKALWQKRKRHGLP